MYPDQAAVAKGVELVVTDRNGAGWFLELWRRLSYPHPLRILHDNPFPPGTCFKHAITHGRGPRSLLTQLGVGTMTRCRSLPLHAMRVWLHALTAEVGAGIGQIQADWARSCLLCVFL